MNTSASSALRFFYGKTLARVVSPEEVAQLLESALPGREQVLLKTAYACGLRLMEVLKLKVQDIDSAHMLMHVRQSHDNQCWLYQAGT